MKITALAAAIGWALMMPAPCLSSGSDVAWDPPMQIPSPAGRSAWFPEVAVDLERRVHVVWCDSDHARMQDSRPDPARRQGNEGFLYSRWDGRQWTPARPVVRLQPHIVRGAGAVDQRDLLHVALGFSPGP